MSQDQSISSSIEDYHQSEANTSKKSLRHQISTLSIRSVSELDRNDSHIDTDSISGQPKQVNNSSEYNKYDETFETERSINESNNYSETFESSSSTSSTSSKSSSSSSYSDSLSRSQSPVIIKKKNAAAAATASAASRQDRTLSTASLESILSEINDQTWQLDKKALNELRTTNFVKYVRAKIEMNRHQVMIVAPPKVKYHSAQIKKLVEKTLDWSTSQPSDTNSKYKDYKIEPYLINKLKAKHLIKQINADQLKKIDDLGSSLKLPESIHRQAYYRSKLDQIKYAMSKNEFEKNETNFCDGILKVGELARDLPKLSDQPDLIWNKLLKPLNDLKANKKIQEKFY